MGNVRVSARRARVSASLAGDTSRMLMSNLLSGGRSRWMCARRALSTVELLIVVLVPRRSWRLLAQFITFELCASVGNDLTHIIFLSFSMLAMKSLCRNQKKDLKVLKGLERC